MSADKPLVDRLREAADHAGDHPNTLESTEIMAIVALLTEAAAALDVRKPVALDPAKCPQCGCPKRGDYCRVCGMTF